MLTRDPGERRAARRPPRDADRGGPADRGGRRGRAIGGAAAVIRRGALQPRRGADGRRPDGAGESAVREGDRHRSRSRDGALQLRAGGRSTGSRPGGPAPAARPRTASGLDGRRIVARVASRQWRPATNASKRSPSREPRSMSPAAATFLRWTSSRRHRPRLSQFADAAATIKQALALLPPGTDDEQARDLRSRLEEYERAIPNR